LQASASSTDTAQDFSLVLGGPLFQIFRRAHLSGNGLELLRRRLILFTMLAWLPLLILSAVKGTAWGNVVSLSFIKDIEAHARFLISLPLLIGAEVIVQQRMQNITRQFLGRGLIPDEARPKFDRAIASAKRLRDSLTAELLLIALVYCVVVFFSWRRHSEFDVSSWYFNEPEV